MNPSYDLSTRPFVPVLDPEGKPAHTHDGEPGLLGLRETLLRAHEVRGLGATVPSVESGLLRVLTLLAARVTGLDQDHDPERWHRRRTAVLQQEGQFDPAAVEAYFARHADRFDLFHTEHPWLQNPRLAEQQSKTSGINALDPSRPPGNTLVWHTHTWSAHAPVIPAAEAARWLLHHHFHGTGGAGGYRDVGNGVANQYLTAPPLRGALAYYPVADDLFSTLIANIPSPAVVPHHGEVDAAPWETEASPNPMGMPPSATWPAGILLSAHQRHAQLLTPDATGENVTDYRLTWAFDQRAAEFADPYTIREPRGARWVPREASSSRAVWRDLDALLADTANHARPPVLTAAATLPRPLRYTVRVRALGMDQDRKATDRAFVTSETPPLLRWLDVHDPDQAQGAVALHTAAEDVASTMATWLRRAYMRMSVDTNKPGNTPAPWEREALAAFWPAAERLFWQRMHTGDFTEPVHAFTSTAHTVVDEVTGPRQHHMPVAKAIAEVHRGLAGQANKTEPHTKETTR